MLVNGIHECGKFGFTTQVLRRAAAVLGDSRERHSRSYLPNMDLRHGKEISNVFNGRDIYNSLRRGILLIIS